MILTIPLITLYGICMPEYALKYNPYIGYNCELVDSSFTGTPFDGIPFIDYIEQAPLGDV